MIIEQLILQQNKQIQIYQLGLGLSFCALILLSLVIFMLVVRIKELKNKNAKNQ